MPSSQFDLLLAVKSQGASQVAADIKGIGTAAQGAAGQTNTLPTSFAKVTQTASGMNSTITKTQQVMGATVQTVSNTSRATSSWTSVLKNNVLAIGTAASGVIGLVTQYTQLQKAQVMAQKSAVIEIGAKNRVIDLTNKLTADTAKYGATSQQVAKDQRDLAKATELSGIATQRADILQEQFNERLADFAVNILPNIISVGTGVIQTIQGFRGAQEAAAAVTTITGDAIAVQNAQMLIAKTGAGELAIANDALATSEIAAGEAAIVAGSAMRTALIRTGIGAILVALGTALVAFTQNWWGFRDAVNSAGVAIGKAFPGLTAVLNLHQQVGTWMNRLFGVEVPQSADAASSAIEGVGAAGTKAAEESKKAAEDIAKSWQDTVKRFDISAFSGKFKDQFKAIAGLGFEKSAIHKIKFGLQFQVDEPQKLIQKMTDSLKFISDFHLPASDQRKWANNFIDDMTKAIDQAKGKLDFMKPIVDSIRENKKSSNLSLVVAQQFNALPQAIKDQLKNIAGIDVVEDIMKPLGFTAESLAAATKAQYQTPAFTNAIGDISAWIVGEKGTTGGTDPLKEKGKSMIQSLIDGINEAKKTATDIFTDIFTGDWNKLLADATKVGSGLLANIVTGFTAGVINLADIQKGITQIVNGINAAFVAERTNLEQTGKTIWGQIQIGWTAITTAGTDIANWLSGQINSSWATIKAIGAEIWKQISFGIGDAVNKETAWWMTWIKGNPPAEGATPTTTPPNDQQQLDTTVKNNVPQAQLKITDAVTSITRLIGDFLGYVKVVNSNNPVAKIDITTAVKSITQLIGDFGGYFSIVTKANPIARLDITGAVKSITRLIGDFNGWIKVVEKANPKVKIDITGAVKSIDRLIGDLNGIPNISRTVTIHTQKVTDFAKGGILSMAQGGVISAAQGRMFTSTHEQLVNISDNPGQRESVIFVPHNDPGPTMLAAMKMFFGGDFGGHGGNGGVGQVVVPVSLNISGNSIINEQHLYREVRANIGNTQNMGKFKH